MGKDKASCVIWHLSDFHFAKTKSNFSISVKEVGNQTRPTLLKDMLNTFFESAQPQYKPDVIVITGDIVQSGEEYKTVEGDLDEFFNVICSICPTVVVIPGNHDIVRNGQYAGKDKRFDAFNSYFKHIEKKQQRASKNNYARIVIPQDKKVVYLPESNLLFYCFSSGEELGGIRTGLIEKIRSRCRDRINDGTLDSIILKEQLDILADEQAMHQDLQGRTPHRLKGKILAHFSAIIDDVLKDKRLIRADRLDVGLVLEDADTINENIRKELATVGSQPSREMTRIALVHHHITPHIRKDIQSHDMTANAGQFIQELGRSKFNLVLHGHKHGLCRNYFEMCPLYSNNETHIMSAICGGALDLTEEESANFFSIILLNHTDEQYNLRCNELVPVKLDKLNGRFVRQDPVRLNMDFQQRFHEEVLRERKNRAVLKSPFKAIFQDKAGTIMGNMLRMNETCDEIPTIFSAFAMRVLDEVKEVTSPFAIKGGDVDSYLTSVKDLINKTQNAGQFYILNTMAGDIESYLTDQEIINGYRTLVDITNGKQMKIKNLLIMPLQDYIEGSVFDMESFQNGKATARKVHENRSRESRNPELFEMKVLYVTPKWFCPMDATGNYQDIQFVPLDCAIILNETTSAFSGMGIGEIQIGYPFSSFQHVVIEKDFAVQSLISNIEDVYNRIAMDPSKDQYLNLVPQDNLLDRLRTEMAQLS